MQIISHEFAFESLSCRACQRRIERQTNGTVTTASATLNASAVRSRDRNLLLAEVRDCTFNGTRNPVAVCLTSPLSSLIAISFPYLFCFQSPTHNLPQLVASNATFALKGAIWFFLGHLPIALLLLARQIMPYLGAGNPLIRLCKFVSPLLFDKITDNYTIKSHSRDH